MASNLNSKHNSMIFPWFFMINNVFQRLFNAWPPTSPFNDILTMLSMWNAASVMYLNKHAFRSCMHFEIMKTWNHQLLMVLSNYFTKHHDFPWLFRFFQIPWFFHAWNFFFMIFQIFHGFQSLWETCYHIYLKMWTYPFNYLMRCLK